MRSGGRSPPSNRSFRLGLVLRPAVAEESRNALSRPPALPPDEPICGPATGQAGRDAVGWDGSPLSTRRWVVEPRPVRLANPESRSTMPDESEPTFEQALTRLERIVDELERGEPA